MFVFSRKQWPWSWETQTEEGSEEELCSSHEIRYIKLQVQSLWMLSILPVRRPTADLTHVCKSRVFSVLLRPVSREMKGNKWERNEDSAGFKPETLQFVDGTLNPQITRSFFFFSSTPLLFILSAHKRHQNECYWCEQSTEKLFPCFMQLFNGWVLRTCESLFISSRPDTAQGLGGLVPCEVLLGHSEQRRKDIFMLYILTRWVSFIDHNSCLGS